MVSARAAGTYALYIEKPTGERRLVKSADAAFWNVANLGSQDGTISTSATPEKWNYLAQSADRGTAGYMITLEYTASGATTIDASDCVGIIPVVVNGNRETIGINGGNGIGNPAFTSVLAASDSAFVANVPTPVFKIRANEGINFSVGGDKVFLSLENNA